MWVAHTPTHLPSCGSSFSVYIMYLYVSEWHTHTTIHIYHPLVPPSLCILCRDYVKWTHTGAHVHTPMAPPPLCILCICMGVAHPHPPTHSHTHVPSCGSSFFVHIMYICVSRADNHTQPHIYHLATPPSLCLLCIYQYVDRYISRLDHMYIYI